jgi:hypothetical protein
MAVNDNGEGESLFTHHISCCVCGVQITYNASALCQPCLRASVNVAEVRRHSCALLIHLGLGC